MTVTLISCSSGMSKDKFKELRDTEMQTEDIWGSTFRPKATQQPWLPPLTGSASSSSQAGRNEAIGRAGEVATWRGDGFEPKEEKQGYQPTVRPESSNPGHPEATAAKVDARESDAIVGGPAPTCAMWKRN